MSELQTLWQSTAPAIDAEALIGRLKRQNRLLRRVNLVSFGISAASLVVILIFELSGHLPTRGLLSVFGTLGFVWSVWKYCRDKRRLIAAYSEEPGKLLPFLVGRTRAARNMGACLFLLTPASVACGYLLGYLLDESPGDAASFDPPLGVLIPALILIGVPVVFGFRLWRQKSRELRKLLELSKNNKAT